MKQASHVLKFPFEQLFIVQHQRWISLSIVITDYLTDMFKYAYVVTLYE
jgi:hypothetical protein